MRTLNARLAPVLGLLLGCVLSLGPGASPRLSTASAQEGTPRAPAPAQAPADACAGSANFLIGAARSDITGPAAEVGMMGYAQVSPEDGGHPPAAVLARVRHRLAVQRPAAWPSSARTWAWCSRR